MNIRKKLATAALAVGLVALPTAASAISPTGDFEHRIPRFGSSTDGEQFVTSSSYNDINIRFNVNPYTLSVKPVRCDNGNNISGYKQVSANDHSWKVIASSVLDGTCYQLNMDAGTTAYFDVEGDVAD